VSCFILNAVTSIDTNCPSLTSRAMGPVKALGRMGMFGKMMNNIDGGVEVLDDLNDHWTAKNHKQERSVVIEDLQDLAIDKSLRITLLRYVALYGCLFLLLT
jgi:hypothetical protein